LGSVSIQNTGIRHLPTCGVVVSPEVRVLAGIAGAGFAQVLDAFQRVGRDRLHAGVLADRARSRRPS
jgi:hypothetical protein